LRSLPPSGPDSIINPANGYIRVKPTMQFADPSYPNFFAVGDIADTGTHKAALPGLAQGATVAKNIQSMLAGQRPTEIFKGSPAAIHLTLGLVSIESRRRRARTVDMAHKTLRAERTLRIESNAFVPLDLVSRHCGIVILDLQPLHHSGAFLEQRNSMSAPDREPMSSIRLRREGEWQALRPRWTS